MRRRHRRRKTKQTKKKAAEPMGADDLLPLLAYAVVLAMVPLSKSAAAGAAQASPPLLRPHAQAAAMAALNPETGLGGEGAADAFTLASFQSAALFVRQLGEELPC